LLLLDLDRLQLVVAGGRHLKVLDLAQLKCELDIDSKDEVMGAEWPLL
jgi:hypothetical protein